MRGAKRTTTSRVREEEAIAQNIIGAEVRTEKGGKNKGAGERRSMRKEERGGPAGDEGSRKERRREMYRARR